MIEMTLQQVAKQCDAHLMMANNVAEPLIKQVSTDSRKTMKDGLFIALKGENFDGHEYISTAQKQGAVACLVQQEVETQLPTLMVANTQNAMGELASSVREQLAIPCVGITGSSGKTTVKEMIAAILREMGAVLATEANFNNAIGVPLTLFRLTKEDQFAVIEMGASKVGDIDEIAQWVKPDVAVITNVSEAHLQGLGDLQGVASVKGELLDHLKTNGTAILSHQSEFLNQWSDQLTQVQSLITIEAVHNSFSENTTTDGADYSSSTIIFGNSGDTKFTAHTPMGSIEIESPFTGGHNVTNALTAIAAANAMGASLNECASGLCKMKTVKGRMEILPGIFNSRIINDSYNANPASLKAAMESLMSFEGTHLLVLGDMGELGEQSEFAHHQAGVRAKKLGIEHLYATGNWSTHAVAGFGTGAHFYESKQELSKAIEKQLKTSKEGRCNLLIKGSRSAAMEELLEPLVVKNKQQVLNNATDRN